jgi:hypothetical protein
LHAGDVCLSFGYEEFLCLAQAAHAQKDEQ